MKSFNNIHLLTKIYNEMLQSYVCFSNFFRPWICQYCSTVSIRVVKSIKCTNVVQDDLQSAKV